MQSHGDKCKYFLNETDDLILFADNSFDFIYSNLVTSAHEARYSKRYIREFLRVLAPRGLPGLPTAEQRKAVKGQCD